MSEKSEQLDSSGEIKKEEVPKKTELERRFLVATLPPLDGCTSIEMRAAFPVMRKGYEDRIRQEGGTFERVIKTGESGEKDEQKIESTITPEEFEELWSRSVIKNAKTRYTVDIGGGLVAELDLWHNAMHPDEGTATVEVEFPTRKQKLTFNKPYWFGREVTNDEAYQSPNLAKSGMPEEAKIESLKG